MPKPEDVLIDAVMEATARAATAVYESEGFRLEVGERRLLKRSLRAGARLGQHWATFPMNDFSGPSRDLARGSSGQPQAVTINSDVELDTKRIFVSWSGERSRSAALGLKSLLVDVLGESLDVFISAHMDPGVVWVQELGRELEGSDFGILCLTQDNVQSPWLLFEAGAIAKNFGAARVVPYLIDDLVLTGPLNQFQHVRADYQGTLRLLESINTLREKSTPVDRLHRSFDKWWADLEQTLANLPGAAHPAIDISDRNLLETIWQGVQSLLNSGAQTRANIIALPKAETAHLLNLRDRPEMVYTGGDSLKKEMRMLRDLGLIRNTQPIAGLPKEFKLKDRFSLTDTGRQYVDTISPSSSNAT